MIAPGNGLIQALLAVAFVIAGGYALGRIHQWYRDGAARDASYRNGYDRASDCMLDMALRKRTNGPGDVPAAPAGDLAPRGERLVAVHSVDPDVPPARQLVGHARRRIVAGRFSCAGPGAATH